MPPLGKIKNHDPLGRRRRQGGVDIKWNGPLQLLYLYVYSMYVSARVFNSLSSCEMCTNRMENITTKSRAQSKRGSPEISSINTEFLHISITHMNANISFLYEVRQ